MSKNKNMSSLYPIKAEIAIERAGRVVSEWGKELKPIFESLQKAVTEFDKKPWFYKFLFERPKIANELEISFKIYDLKDRILRAETIITNAKACGEQIIYLSESDMEILSPKQIKMSTNSKQISPAELATGMFVTVLENKPYTHESGPSIIIGGVETKTIVKEDNSGKGNVLTVLAVQLPYVIVRKESEYAPNRLIRKIDTRRTLLMELSEEYVGALCPYLFTKV